MISQKLEYKSLEDVSIDNYEPVKSAPNVADAICKMYSDVRVSEKINDPGMRVYIEISTGQDRKTHLKMDIPLNGICCKRTCLCQIAYRNPINKQDIKVLDLTEELILKTKHDSYYCEDELKSCMEDCRKEAGDKLASE